ncbi:MAG: hypothetical protein HY323_15045 [Betaproteobacteria bacterium]|nr:hypothetical protein [Betaproteobacteria bacterium]MBI3938294.1 hypothetical protein [Betaproteobacteria bacterium]
MIKTLLWLATLFSLLPALQAQAQSAWPGKVVRIIVPFAAGSFTDVAARSIGEAGFPGYNMSYWWGIAAPAATPPQVVSRLNQEVARAADKPKLKDSFLKRGARAVTGSSGEFSRRVNEEIKVWKDVIARAGVKLQ